MGNLKYIFENREESYPFDFYASVTQADYEAVKPEGIFKTKVNESSGGIYELVDGKWEMVAEAMYEDDFSNDI